MGVKNGKEVACDYCGSVVYRSKAQLDRSKSGLRFCSKQCMGSYLSREVQSNHNVICGVCGISFRKSPSTIKEVNYCSRVCWKKGIASTGVSQYRKHKKSECEECGFIPEDKCQLDVHHINSDHEDNSEENLQTLCANCHRLVHHKLRVSYEEEL